MDRPLKWRAFFLSVLISGFVIALFSNAPLVNICNCLLCIWVWGGTLLGVFLYRKLDREAGPLTILQGMLLGLSSGVLAAIIGAGLAAILNPIAIKSVNALIESLPSLAEPLSPYTELLEAGGSGALIGFLIDLVLYSIFGALGGILGSFIFKDRKPAAEGGISAP